LSHSFLPHLLSHNLRASSACYFHYPAPKKTVFTPFSSRDPLASKKQTPICLVSPHELRGRRYAISSHDGRRTRG
jgi:hypothetical protein